MSDASPLLPIRPTDSVDGDIAIDPDLGFEHLEDAGVDVEKGDARIDAD